VTVRAERLGEKRILAQVPWMNGRGSVLAKQIPGVTPKWERGAGPGGKDLFIGWSFPLDLETCREMRRVFGDALVPGPELTAWARHEVMREQRLARLRTGQAEAGPLPRMAEIAPVLDAALRPYQRTGVQFAAEGKSVLIADQPGLGKTLETLGALAETDCKRVVVFCRKTALNAVWKREAERWLGDRCVVFVASGGHSDREAVINAFNYSCAMPDGKPVMRILVANIEMVRARKLCPEGLPEKDCLRLHKHEKQPVKFHVEPDWPELFAAPYDAIVVDESHRALVGKSARSKNVTQARLGMMYLPLREGGLRIALSGTPFRGRNYASWGTLNWLRPDIFTSYWRFADMYFKVEENAYGGREVGELRPEREADFNRMLGAYMLRRTKAECAPDLPAKQYSDVWLEMEPAQEKAYRQMEADGDAQIEGGTLTAVGVLAEMTRLKQFASSAGKVRAGEFIPGTPSNKLNWVLDFLEAREGNPGKVLIFSQFTQLVEMFYFELERLRPNTNKMITGKTLQKNRDLYQEQFQKPDSTIQVMLLNTLAGGESITLDQANDVIFLDETWIPDEQEQAEDRAHRVSRIHNVNVYYLRSSGTIEQDIYEVAGTREGSVRAVLDGSRGIEIRKQRMESKSVIR
jgi:SNF2 family DNA or RNA helicase